MNTVDQNKSFYKQGEKYVFLKFKPNMQRGMNIYLCALHDIDMAYMKYVKHGSLGPKGVFSVEDLSDNSTLDRHQMFSADGILTWDRFHHEGIHPQGCWEIGHRIDATLFLHDLDDRIRRAADQLMINRPDEINDPADNLDLRGMRVLRDTVVAMIRAVFDLELRVHRVVGQQSTLHFEPIKK